MLSKSRSSGLSGKAVPAVWRWDEAVADRPVPGERVILRDVPLYVCCTPGCENTQLPLVIRGLADQLEALVQETLSVQQVWSPERYA